jgi:BirA family biotin operon repressor/biotin-[acetyl-CoA-carboxylase] ligase
MSARLDADAIRAALPAALCAQLVRIEVVASTQSTQADALAAGAPERGCALFLAEHQLGGVGRQGRAWHSAPADASLPFSLARRFARPLPALSGLSLVAGIALAEALGLDAVRLKWPNDLVAQGRKLGGILVNLRNAGDGDCEAVIGVGLNLRLPADAAIDQPWIDLAALGAAPESRNLLVARLLSALLPALELFEAEGLAPFHARWQRLDALSGQPVQVLDGPRVHAGESAGISASGALRLRDGAGVREFASGEVSLRPA